MDWEGQVEQGEAAEVWELQESYTNSFCEKTKQGYEIDRVMSPMRRGETK